MTTHRTEVLFCAGLVLVLVLLQGGGLSRPFLRHHESNGTGFGKSARNHLKFGLAKTCGLMLDVSGPRLEAYGDYRAHYYSNHPPLSALLLAGAFAAAGVSEATFRAFLIAFSVVALLLFRRIAARVLQAPYDRIATACFAFLPMFVYYSIVTCLHVVALVGVLGAFLSYLRWVESPTRGRYAAIVGSIVFACYSSWEGYYAAPALVAAHLWSRRPKRGAVLGLLGVNVAIFGVYLLHLWAADPSHLAPLRSLLSAGADRSSMQGMSLVSYVLGEGRELFLMFTLPVLALVAVWAGSLVRGPRRDSDGLILGSWCLGLHEIVFAKLASQHEYYSYFLVIPAALGAAAGLQRLTDRIGTRSRAASLAAAGLIVAAFLGQSAGMLPRRLRREGGYEFYYRLGLALRDVVAPEERVFLLTDNLPFYTPFYGDRYALWYDAPHRLLMAENTGPRRSDVGEEELLRLLRENPDRLDWAVTAEKGSAVSEVAWLRSLDDPTLEAFGVETRRTPRRNLLEERYGPPRVHGGFLFWNLRKRG